MDKNFVVTKSNYFIENSSYELSIEEQRIILTLSSMVQPEDQDFKVYTIKIAEFLELIGVVDQSKYTELPKITRELMKKVFEIKEEKTTLQVAWLSSAEYDHEKGSISLEFSPRLKPYFLQLKSYFTNYKLANILSMKSKYSPRLYELLKMNEFNKKGFVVEVEELRRLFKAQDIYPKYNDFKKYIILKAQEELQKHSDIKFEFEEVKYGRRVESIKFFIFSNTNKKIENKKNTRTKTSKELKADKVIKEQEETIKNSSKINEKIKKSYEEFLNMPKEEQKKIEIKAYKEFLKETQAEDNKISKDIFEKTKKSLILKVL